jgi:hypothetical protein
MNILPLDLYQWVSRNQLTIQTSDELQEYLQVLQSDILPLFYQIYTFGETISIKVVSEIPFYNPLFPVIQISIKDMTIRVLKNRDDWIVSIDSKSELIINTLGLFDPDYSPIDSSFNAYTLSLQSSFLPCYSANKTQFSVVIEDELKLFGFFVLIVNLLSLKISDIATRYCYN